MIWFYLRPVFAASLLVILLGGCVLAAQLGLTSLSDTVYDLEGIQAGEPAPQLPIYATDGSVSPIELLWTKRPVLIVNGSYTCPVARLNNPGLADLQQRYANHLDVVVLYVYEPHPKGDPSPYTGREWVTFANIFAGILHRQPRTLAERLLLARKFDKHLEGQVPVYVDSMDNRYWRAVGGGPNTALLVNSNGRVIVKQGWYNQKNMQTLLDDYFGLPPAMSSSPRRLLRRRPHR